MFVIRSAIHMSVCFFSLDRSLDLENPRSVMDCAPVPLNFD
ncbi:unnamed protein product [Rhodiola kirilowii]